MENCDLGIAVFSRGSALDGGLGGLPTRFSRMGGIEIFYPAGAETRGEEGKRTVPRR